MTHPFRIAAAVAAASLSIVLVAGCGGSDSATSSSAADTSAAVDTTAVDTTAVGTDVGMAINAACEQFSTDGAAAASADDYPAFASAFEAYRASVAEAANSAPDDTAAAAYLEAVDASEAKLQAIKAEVDGGATVLDAGTSVDTAEVDQALRDAAEAGGYDTCSTLHAE